MKRSPSNAFFHGVDDFDLSTRSSISCARQPLLATPARETRLSRGGKKESRWDVAFVVPFSTSGGHDRLATSFFQAKDDTPEKESGLTGCLRGRGARDENKSLEKSTNACPWFAFPYHFWNSAIFSCFLLRGTCLRKLVRWIQLLLCSGLYINGFYEYYIIFYFISEKFDKLNDRLEVIRIILERMEYRFQVISSMYVYILTKEYDKYNLINEFLHR